MPKDKAICVPGCFLSCNGPISLINALMAERLTPKMGCKVFCRDGGFWEGGAGKSGEWRRLAAANYFAAASLGFGKKKGRPSNGLPF
jgi:hypothetical protein